MFNKIGAIIEFIFVAAFAAATALVCYYYCWLSPWSMVKKGFAMFGFCFWGLLDMFISFIFGFFMWDETTDDGIGFAIASMIVAFVIPGLIFLIGIIVTRANKARLRRRYATTTTTTYVPPPKKKIKEYNPKEDPTIIDKRTKPEEKKPKIHHVKPGAPSKKTQNTGKKTLMK